MRRFLLLFILLLGSVAHLSAQQPVMRRVAPYILYVKFPDETDYKVTERQLSLTDPGAAPVLLQLKSLGWWSRVHQLPKEQLEAYRKAASQRLGKKLKDMNTEFHFHLYQPARLQEARDLLLQLPGVEKVLKVPVPVNAAAPNLTSMQAYCKSGNSGINADSVGIRYNNRGAGIKVCDIEYSYNAQHQDLPAVTNVNGPLYDPFNSTDHGTAVLGIIAAKKDTAGVTGIASDCSLFFSAACLLPDSTYDLERAVTDALPHLSAGDIILFEQQIEGPNLDTVNPSSQKGLVPVEWFEPYYDMIQLATGLGITVVEAAGNGQQNLDAPEYATGNGGHYPFLAANNSGAIIVGAGAVGTTLGGSDAARSRMWYSNYGSRVDLQGNGERVYTTGYGDVFSVEGRDKFYTADFGGTSGASPMVVGAVALFQSVHRQVKRSLISTADMLAALKATGKAQANGINPAATYHIGPLPDIYKAIRSVVATNVTTVNTAAGWTVFPNPATGKFTLQLKRPLEADGMAEVTDAMGRRVATPSLNAGMQQADIDLSAFPDGLYLLTVRAGGSRETAKLILQH